MAAPAMPLLLSLLVLGVSSSSSSTPGSSVVGGEYALAAADVRRIADAIRQVVESEMADAPLGGQYRPFVAGFIRLAFHSCVGDRCIGCLNVNDPSNNGLNASVTALERVRSQLGIGIRRGDLWALAAKVAYKVGVKLAGGSEEEADAVRFQYGRDDCPTAPLSNSSLAYPDKRWGADATLGYFAERGFAARETAALMGFHTLGVVRDGPAKAIGQWVSTPDMINNQFYVDLLRLNWTQRATLFHSTPGAAETVFTWGVGADAAAPRMMINADVAVVRNFSVADNATGRSHCSAASVCAAPSDTLAAAQAFANDSKVWRSEASAALTKLIERGYGGGGGAGALREPTADASSSPVPPSGAALRRRSTMALLAAAAAAGAALTGGWHFAS